MDHSNHSEPRIQNQKNYIWEIIQPNKKNKTICLKTRADCKLAKNNFYEQQIGRNNGSQTLFKIVKDLNSDMNNEQECTVDCHDMI